MGNREEEDGIMFMNECTYQEVHVESYFSNMERKVLENSIHSTCKWLWAELMQKYILITCDAGICKGRLTRSRSCLFVCLLLFHWLVWLFVCFLGTGNVPSSVVWRSRKTSRVFVEEWIIPRTSAVLWLVTHKPQISKHQWQALGEFDRSSYNHPHS